MAVPADFYGSNARLAPGKGTEDHVGHLPCYISPGGEVISRWRPSALEIAQIVATGDIWLSQMTYGNALQPQQASGLPLMSLIDEDGQPLPGYDPDTQNPDGPVRVQSFDEPTRG